VRCVQAGAGNGDEGVAAGGGSGICGARGEGQQGRGRRVGVIPAGGGAAAVVERRPGAKHCAGGKGAEKRGEGSGGPVWKFQESQGPLGKAKFPTDLKV
jgi:hypothetical protein